MSVVLSPSPWNPKAWLVFMYGKSLASRSNSAQDRAIISSIALRVNEITPMRDGCVPAWSAFLISCIRRWVFPQPGGPRISFELGIIVFTPWSRVYPILNLRQNPTARRSLLVLWPQNNRYREWWVGRRQLVDVWLRYPEQLCYVWYPHQFVRMGCHLRSP